MKKAVLKRTADALEKMAIAGMAVGIFQGHTFGVWAGIFFMILCYSFTIWEAKK